ncbi:hypothetical protein ABZX85_22620 [Streptomyces sp. NPDC004539]|uniref:hypothetical protein n=1 Tax=Streptomyces sp. NPDC004539 TaxID=3154280 RepID=UPI0033A8EBE8
MPHHSTRSRLAKTLLVGVPLTAVLALACNARIRATASALATRWQGTRSPAPTRPGTLYEFDAAKLSQWCDSDQLRAAAPHTRHLLALRTTPQGEVKSLLLIDSGTHTALLEFKAPAPVIHTLRQIEEHEEQRTLMHRFATAHLLPMDHT